MGNTRINIDSDNGKQDLAKAIQVLGYLKDEYSDLQDKYADISLGASTGDEPEVTRARAKNAQVFFASATAGVISSHYNFIDRLTSEEAPNDSK